MCPEHVGPQRQKAAWWLPGAGGGVGRDCSRGRGFLLGGYKCSGTRRRWGLRKVMNMLQAMEMFTLKWLVLCRVNFTLRKKSRSGGDRSPAMRSQGPSPVVRQPQQSWGKLLGAGPMGKVPPEEAQSPCHPQLRARGKSPVQAAVALLPKEAGQQGQSVERTIYRCLNKTRGSGPGEWDAGVNGAPSGPPAPPVRPKSCHSITRGPRCSPSKSWLTFDQASPQPEETPSTGERGEREADGVSTQQAGAVESPHRPAG